MLFPRMTIRLTSVLIILLMSIMANSMPTTSKTPNNGDDEEATLEDDTEPPELETVQNFYQYHRKITEPLPDLLYRLDQAVAFDWIRLLPVLLGMVTRDKSTEFLAGYLIMTSSPRANRETFRDLALFLAHLSTRGIFNVRPRQAIYRQLQAETPEDFFSALLMSAINAHLRYDIFLGRGEEEPHHQNYETAIALREKMDHFPQLVARGRQFSVSNFVKLYQHMLSKLIDFYEKKGAHHIFDQDQKSVIISYIGSLFEAQRESVQISGGSTLAQFEELRVALQDVLSRRSSISAVLAEAGANGEIQGWLDNTFDETDTQAFLLTIVLHALFSHDVIGSTMSSPLAMLHYELADVFIESISGDSTISPRFLCDLLTMFQGFGINFLQLLNPEQQQKARTVLAVYYQPKGQYGGAEVYPGMIRNTEGGTLLEMKDDPSLITEPISPEFAQRLISGNRPHLIYRVFTIDIMGVPAFLKMPISDLISLKETRLDILHERAGKIDARIARLNDGISDSKQKEQELKEQLRLIRHECILLNISIQRLKFERERRKKTPSRWGDYPSFMQPPVPNYLELAAEEPLLAITAQTSELSVEPPVNGNTTTNKTELTSVCQEPLIKLSISTGEIYSVLTPARQNQSDTEKIQDIQCAELNRQKIEGGGLVHGFNEFDVFSQSESFCGKARQ